MPRITRGDRQVRCPMLSPSELKTMSSMAALFSPTLHLTNVYPSSYQNPLSFSSRPPITLRLRNPASSLSPLNSSADNGVSTSDSSPVVVEPSVDRNEPKPSEPASEEGESLFGTNGSAGAEEVVSKFEDPKWVGGTWDLRQFQKNGATDWDAVIDAEARRRKWLATTPETSSNDEPVSFDTSIIPWWAWIKRYHLPEAELLNGRAAMIGFFMAYLVDSLTGVGLVDQTGNFLCKSLLFIAVVGVLLIRKNEDLETIKKLLDETTFYDKQWQATWEDQTPTKSSSKEEL